MALKALLLRKKLDGKKKDLEALRDKDADFQRREAELETAIGETESPEDQQAVETLVGEFDADKQVHEDAKNTLTREIAELEQQLADEESKQPPANPGHEEKPPHEDEERNDETIMSMKHRDFFGLDIRRRDQFLARDDVKDFLQRVRSLVKEKRVVSGAELTIPDVVLELIRTAIPRYSKLIARVNLKPVPGTARQNIMGTVPEAVWTEACASLNELDLYFNQVEVDGYKVGGFIAVCNATLEDSDLNLATEVMDALGQAIGYAADKAIVYGTGKKMPLGIVTRLTQTAQPENWGAHELGWKDLSTSNVITITGKSGLELYKEIILESSAADHTYSRGPLTWIMNELTKNTLGSAGSQVAIEVNGKAQANGGSASWSDGDNTVKVTVSFGGRSKVYTVTVNKAGA